MKSRICPLCSRTSIHFFAKLKMYTYYRCELCKTIFTFPRISQKKLDRFYKDTFTYADGSINEHIIRTRSKKIIQQLVTLKGNNASLCDVGSGYGFFLDCAKPYFNEILGIEPAKVLAKSSHLKFNLPVYIGTAHEYLQSKHSKKYDIITSIHVIEHLANPQKHIKDLFTLLNPGGLLYIETPNADSFLLYAEKSNYTFLLAPEHPWIFSRFSFKQMLQKYKCNMQFKTYSYSEHFMGILKAILKKRKNQEKKEVEGYQLSHSSNDSLRKSLFYYLFDLCIAKIATPLLTINHKGSILELYINKK